MGSTATSAVVVQLEHEIETTKDHLDQLNERLREQTTVGWLAIVNFMFGGRIQYVRISDRANNPFDHFDSSSKPHRQRSYVKGCSDIDQVRVLFSGWNEPEFEMKLEDGRSRIPGSFVFLTNTNLDALTRKAEAVLSSERRNKSSALGQ
ncbi:hypothetical protein A3C09_03840 [Candidatus Uhrbacteria bacterium RIFCSPHIGHO2_02_FULL_47_44]|uniref:Uncharacterized protein n=1 Tax=Candidatus Uhrbacteria bacterium RIFCSPLOWO2_02_FULL_48_18 TaxID=1802408 RepID=A0A1F7VCP7_9BACT|nr:MAG: hypothetical protein A2839_00680 [Candidatus Uhrbacteria bacterium RIFCSPHIGHO2_01_FULL_47_10]OGL71810.1 MAG: hypothetical protein A3C09_03840 [Candidatus Uhrbacteria bacterium RIFCSPHIGHO2_02_FULL_47_44]OGL80616.1 MAG: hypothetical protein A3B20_04445 [Candidatus Uhrbacteria bacterium RIFCSPLOWO2_01_FULL_47_17]OGL88201.1 MAG: hypothetical protein A3I41_00535 [Candidatus Uhrbacteria bacterium RIFCSPLOWO2_02_FULL_48_18]